MGKLIKKYRETIMYLIFGVATTLVNWIVYTLCVEFFNINITLSNAIAWGVAVIFAYITNKLFVFESKSFRLAVLIKESITFLGSRILSGILEIFMPTLLVYIGMDQTLFGVDGFVAKLFVSVFVIIINYILSKELVFNSTKK